MANNSVVVLHHDDLDGWASAWILRSCFHGCKCIPVNFGYDIPWGELSKDTKLYIVDFSYDEATLLKMQSMVESIHLYDHHGTAESKVGHLPFCTFDCSIAGTELVWKVFHSEYHIPELLFAIADRDIWRFSSDNTKPFVAAFNVMGDIKSWEYWDKVITNWDSSYRKQFLSIGTNICASKDAADESMAKKAIPVEIDGNKVGFLNFTGSFSEIGNKIATSPEYDYALAYFVTEKEVSFSFRGADSKIKCSDIADKLGGGGHPNACGFRLPFDKAFQFITECNVERKSSLKKFFL